MYTSVNPIARTGPTALSLPYSEFAGHAGLFLVLLTGGVASPPTGAERGWAATREVGLCGAVTQGGRGLGGTPPPPGPDQPRRPAHAAETLLRRLRELSSAAFNALRKLRCEDSIPGAKPD